MGCGEDVVALIAANAIAAGTVLATRRRTRRSYGESNRAVAGGADDDGDRRDASSFRPVWPESSRLCVDVPESDPYRVIPDWRPCVTPGIEGVKLMYATGRFHLVHNAVLAKAGRTWSLVSSFGVVTTLVTTPVRTDPPHRLLDSPVAQDMLERVKGMRLSVAGWVTVDDMRILAEQDTFAHHYFVNCFLSSADIVSAVEHALDSILRPLRGNFLPLSINVTMSLDARYELSLVQGASLKQAVSKLSKTYGAEVLKRCHVYFRLSPSVPTSWPLIMAHLLRASALRGREDPTPDAVYDMFALQSRRNALTDGLSRMTPTDAWSHTNPDDAARPDALGSCARTANQAAAHRDPGRKVSVAKAAEDAMETRAMKCIVRHLAGLLPGDGFFGIDVALVASYGDLCLHLYVSHDRVQRPPRRLLRKRAQVESAPVEVPVYRRCVLKQAVIAPDGRRLPDKLEPVRQYSNSCFMWAIFDLFAFTNLRYALINHSKFLLDAIASNDKRIHREIVDVMRKIEKSAASGDGGPRFAASVSEHMKRLRESRHAFDCYFYAIHALMKYVLENVDTIFDIRDGDADARYPWRTSLISQTLNMWSTLDACCGDWLADSTWWTLRESLAAFIDLEKCENLPGDQVVARLPTASHPDRACLFHKTTTTDDDRMRSWDGDAIARTLSARESVGALAFVTNHAMVLTVWRGWRDRARAAGVGRDVRRNKDDVWLIDPNRGPDQAFDQAHRIHGPLLSFASATIYESATMLDQTGTSSTWAWAGGGEKRPRRLEESPSTPDPPLGPSTPLLPDREPGDAAAAPLPPPTVDPDQISPESGTRMVLWLFLLLELAMGSSPNFTPRDLWERR